MKPTGAMNVLVAGSLSDRPFFLKANPAPPLPVGFSARRDGEGDTEAEVAVTEMRRIGVATGAAHVVGLVAPAAAAHREAALWVAVARIGDRPARSRAVARRTELPDVAQHVAQSESVRSIRPHRRREGVPVVHRHDAARPVGVRPLQRPIAGVDDLPAPVLVRPPPVARGAAGPTCPLPLRLGGQSVGPARLHCRARPLGQPAAERAAVGMADMDDRVSILHLEGSGIAWLAPGRAGTVLPDRPLVVGVSAAVLLTIGDVLRRFHEAAKLPD